MLVDSHAHLEALDDLESVLTRAKDAGVSKIITIGTSLKSSRRAIEIADFTSLKLRGAKKDFPEIFATCGIHPKDGKGDIENLGISNCIRSLSKIAKSSKKVVAIGECGLDVATTENTENKNDYTEKDKKYQWELFEAQIKLAIELDLPLVVHCRNAWGDIFEIIRGHPEFNSGSGSRNPSASLRASKFGMTGGLRGVFHSWTGDISAMKKALELGFYISFSGIVTFSNAKNIQEAAKVVPKDRILVETDSPFLSPEPFRGQKNEPANVRITAEFLAGIRSTSFNEFAQASMQNAQKLFNS